MDHDATCKGPGSLPSVAPDDPYGFSFDILTKISCFVRRKTEHDKNLDEKQLPTNTQLVTRKVIML